MEEKKILSKDEFSDQAHFKVKTLFTIVYKSNLSIKRLLAHWVTSISVFFYLLFNTKRGDKVLVSSIPPEVLLITAIVSKIKKLDVTIDVRDIWPDAFPLNGVISKFFCYYCTFIYKTVFVINSFKVIYVAPSFLKWIKKYSGDIACNCLHFGFLGFDRERWGVADEHVKNKSDNINLVYIGYLESQFDINNVVSSVLVNKKLTLTVIGDGSKLEEYKSLAKGCSRINFLGLLTPEGASNEMLTCDIGLLPISHTAQMPNKLFDYFGAKLPILCINSSDSSNLVLNEKVGWLVANNIDDISSQLSTICYSDIISMRENLEVIRDKYSKESCYKDISSFILK